MILSGKHLFSVAASAAALALSLVVTPSAHAQLLGGSVTGSLNFNGGGTNFYDPANGFVPNGFTNKTSGTTVTIAEPAIEYGFDDGSNQDSANFTNTSLTVGDIVGTSGAASWTMTFSSAAFSGLSLVEVTDNFPGAGGVTGSLAGNVLTVNFPGTLTPGSFSATFSLTSGTAPEPASGALALMAVTALGIVARRRKV